MPPVAKPWFRMYASILTNRKIQSLKGTEVLGWLNLMALASVQPRRGSLPDMDEMAFQLRVTKPQAQRLISALISAGLVDYELDEYSIHDWNEWQAERDVAPGKRDVTGANAAESSRVNHANVTLSTRENHGYRDFPHGNREENHAREEKSREEGEEEKKRTEQRETTPPRPRPTSHRLFEKGFGRLLTPMELEQITALTEEHPEERIEYAIGESVALGKRNVRYVQRICERLANDDSSESGIRVSNAREDSGRVGDGVPGLDRRSAAIARLGQRSAEVLG